MKIIDKKRTGEVAFEAISLGQCFRQEDIHGAFIYLKISEDDAFNLVKNQIEIFDDDEEVIPCEAEITIY